MKTLFILLFLFPLAGFAQQVLSTERIFPKVDKGAEFEKALTAHVQKFHNTGKFRWRVFEIVSGPDYGGYQISEGPMTWEDIESRGDLGPEHMADWNKSIAPLITDRTTHGYSVFQESLSTIALTDYSDWIQINRWTPKPGHIGDLRGLIENMKKAWVEEKNTVAVYVSSSSGRQGFAIVTRYKQGLKERNTGFRPPFRDTYEKVNGRDSWNEYIETIKNSLETGGSELLRFRADLSSK